MAQMNLSVTFHRTTSICSLTNILSH